MSTYVPGVQSYFYFDNNMGIMNVSCSIVGSFLINKSQ